MKCCIFLGYKDTFLKNREHNVSIALISRSRLMEEAILNMTKDLRDIKIAEETYNEFIKSGEKGGGRVVQ